MEEGVDDLPRDKTRPPRIPPLPPDVVERVVAENNKNPKPFTWNADSDKIFAAVKRGCQALGSNHYASVSVRTLVLSPPFERPMA